MMTHAAQEVAHIARPDEMPTQNSERSVSVATPMEMLASAVERGADLSVVEKLMELQERWEAREGRKAFDVAIADAKGKIPVIGKTREVDFTSNKGRTHYKHEDLAGIARVVDPILADHGLSYRFRTAQEGGMVTVICVLSHRDGYSEETSLTAGRDETGNKNNHQAIASAVTYLQRYTLKAALGLAASDDDDGQSADSIEKLSPEQVKEIETLLRETGSDKAKFLAHGKMPSIEAIPAHEFEAAKETILAAKRKRDAAAEKGGAA